MQLKQEKAGSLQVEGGVRVCVTVYNVHVGVYTHVGVHSHGVHSYVVHVPVRARVGVHSHVMYILVLLSMPMLLFMSMLVSIACYHV